MVYKVYKKFLKNQIEEQESCLLRTRFSCHEEYLSVFYFLQGLRKAEELARDAEKEVTERKFSFDD